MSGARLAAALVVIALLTFVVPPLAARQVHQRRIDAARADVTRIAGELATTSRGAQAGRLFRGPGELPKFASGLTWLTGVPVEPFPALEHAVGPDPWGNHYVAVVAGESVVVLSAGPNGVVETAIGAPGPPSPGQASAGQAGRALPYRPSGDDIVVSR